MVAQRVRVMGMIRAVFVLVTIMPSARKNHRRSGLARLCTLYVCVIVGGLLIGTGVRRWSRQTAIPFESTATTGPAWGHVILEITLSGKTFDEAVRALAVASGARIDVLWGTLPPYLSESARVPEGTSLRNAGLGQALSLLITLCEHDEDHWSRKIVCRAVEGRVYVAAADAGPAVAPVARVFDVRDLLASMSAYRAKHPGFQPNASEWAGMSADNIMSSMPGGSPQVTTSVEDLSDFLRFTSPRSPSLHMSDDMLFVDGRFVAVQPPAVLNDVVLALARLRAADSEGPSMAHAPTGVADASAQLEQILVTVDLGPALLPDAVERLRQITGANLHVNWNRLGIEDLKTHRYELHVKNITLRGALRRLLDGLPLGIRADHGVISVMDSERLDWSSVELEVYDVGDLLDGHHKLPSTEATRFTTWRRESDPRARAAQDLIDAIVAAAPDENWSKNWSVSDIRMTIVGNLLLVRQTPAGQSRIKTVLARLREGP